MTYQKEPSIDEALIAEYGSATEKEVIKLDSTDEALLKDDNDEIIEIDEEEIEIKQPNQTATPSLNAPKDKEKAKADASFAKMRIEKEAFEKTSREKEELVSKLAKRAGFSDVKQFEEAVQKELNKTEAEKAGVPVELYEKMKVMEDKIAAMELQETQKSQEASAQRFVTALDKFVIDLELGEKGKTQVLDRLAEAGYENIEDILAVKNPEILIKGVMADVLETKAVTKQLKTKEERPRVDSERLDISDSVEGNDWEAAYNADLDAYAKANGLTR